MNLTLIRRYVGSRDDLIAAVFAHVSEQLAADVARHPLEGQGHGPDTVMGQWVRIGAALAISGRPMSTQAIHNPVEAIADSLVAGYGLSTEAARVRAAQIVATALGWRIFEDVPRRRPPSWTRSRSRSCARTSCTRPDGSARPRGRPPLDPPTVAR